MLRGPDGPPNGIHNLLLSTSETPPTGSDYFWVGDNKLTGQHGVTTY